MKTRPLTGLVLALLLIAAQGAFALHALEQAIWDRTRDGGNSFDVLTEGLPQAHAYDLVYRHALDVDESGERLAFGSTTGSLWVSDDQGDSWQTVSTHLPPVLCVRFGP